MAAVTILAELVHRRSGLVLGPDKLYLMESRLGSLMRRESLPSLDSLASLIATGHNEALEQDVVEAMATHETLFFRDRRHRGIAGAAAQPPARKPSAHLVGRCRDRAGSLLHCDDGRRVRLARPAQGGNSRDRPGARPDRPCPGRRLHPV